MKKYKAVIVEKPGADFKFVEKEIKPISKEEVLVKVQACGICHGDSIVKDGGFLAGEYPLVPGHEVIGVIEEVGEAVLGFEKGDRVGIGWFGGSCNKCEACLNGEFEKCRNELITGINKDGGYAEYLTTQAKTLVKISDDLKSELVAPLLCAGATTFGALLTSKAKPGDNVVIQGIGGLGHLAIQYANKMGFNTIAISRGNEKKELALELGANVYLDSENEDVIKELHKVGGADVILITAPNSKAATELVKGLAYDGEMVVVAGATEPMQISPIMLLGGNKTIRGYAGADIKKTIKFSKTTHVLPSVETFELDEIEVAYKKMLNAKVKFRSVLIFE